MVDDYRVGLGKRYVGWGLATKRRLAHGGDQFARDTRKRPPRFLGPSWTHGLGVNDVVEQQGRGDALGGKERKARPIHSLGVGADSSSNHGTAHGPGRPINHD